MEPIYIALIAAGGVIFVALIALFIYLSNNLLGVTQYTLTDKRIRAEGVRIVHLSDLHGKRFGKHNKRLIKKVAAAEPDLIAVTGDVIHKYRKKDEEAALELIAALKEVAPVYYVSGNHELRHLNYRQFKGELISAGARVLDDEREEACGVTLCGVNCANIKRGEFFALSDGVQGYKILLAHLPQYITRYAQAGYDCVLCGHAHGGQWRIPFTNKGIYSPGQGLFPKYTGGVHSCGNMRQVISRGLGNSECPLRLFNTPEIVILDLKCE